MLFECLFKQEVTHLVAGGIVVEQTVEADTLDRGHEAARGCKGLQATAGADANAGQRAVLVFLLSRLIVDVGQCVEFGHDDVNIVAADAVALTGDALAFIGAGDGMELAAADLTLSGVEMVGNGIDAGRVAHQDYTVGQLLRLEVQVEAGAVFVDDELGMSKGLFFLWHNR